MTVLGQRGIPDAGTRRDSVRASMSCYVHTQLVDDALGAYIAWREERSGVWQAYQRWSNAPVDDRPSAFSAYWAALDREEKASSMYADRLGELESALERSPAIPTADLRTVV
jgi:hypothetical protein